MAKPKKKEFRLQSKLCDIVSLHPTVLEADAKLIAQMNDPINLLDI